MTDIKNPQDIPTTFHRKLPDGKIEKLDGNGKPAKVQAAAASATPPADPPEDSRNVAELKAALDAAKVEYPADFKKADLVKLAAEHKV